MEEALLEVCRGRASAHAQRCAAEAAEDLTAAEAGVSAAVGALSRGATPGAAAEAAGRAEEAAEGRLEAGGNLPVELDEFGRDTNAEKKMAAAQRCTPP